jgi:hypothetical protein
MSEAPNLDGMWPDDLIELADRIEAEGAAQVAARWFPGEPLGSQAVCELQGYARIKASAMMLRQTGEIARAIIKESECERIYARLPEYAKW